MTPATVRANARRTALAAPARVALFTALAVAGDVAFDPVHRHVPLCPFHALTGWSCPLCGGLRAVDSLVHLRVGTAVHDNLLVVVALPLVTSWWLDWTAHAGTGGRGRALPRATVPVLVAVAVAFTVLRNLPIAAALRPV